MHQQMRTILALACAAVALTFAACGGNDTAATTTPTPTVSYRPGEAPAYQKGGPIFGPAGKARNTVDQLDEIQRQQEQNTGGGSLTPPQP
jgi:hypothetical protein